MHDEQLDRIRELRRFADSLGSTLQKDLRPFVGSRQLMFRRLPTSPVEDPDVATTCTVLMALAGTEQIESIYNDIHPGVAPHETIRAAFDATFAEKWTSSGLETPNPFTAALILRTAGFLSPYVNNVKDRRYQGKWLDTELPTLGQIFSSLVQDCKKNLALDPSLRANPAIAYWLLDGAYRMKVLDFPNAGLAPLSSWASDEFRMHVSLVTSQDNVSMDPVAMAMAACIVERLRTIASQTNDDKVRAQLPSRGESLQGIDLLFKHQEKSGIWDKYFPMFYYRKPGKPGGANYCFAFELLEAVLHEFGTVLFENDTIIRGLEAACRWCEVNRLVYPFDDKHFCGWNSGQQIDSLQTGKPESWATATVHMYLSSLSRACTDKAQQLVLERYRAEYPLVQLGKTPAWERFVDSDVELRGGIKSTVKELVNHLHGSAPPLEPARKSLHPKDRPPRRVRLKGPRSALLFGPPGTSKTTIVRALAERLEWPFLEITPSDFLRGGLEKIYVESNKVFDDLMDLSGVVILFDEMDAIGQERNAQLDVTRQFLTTSMLPKLAKLHTRDVIFVMTTNHKQQLDDAIVRSGRFDLLICVGPPSWASKKLHPDVWIKVKQEEEVVVENVRDRLDQIAEDEEIRKALDLFTIDELKQLVDYFRMQEGGLKAFVANISNEECKRVVTEWSTTVITLREGSDAGKEYDVDRKASKKQY